MARPRGALAGACAALLRAPRAEAAERARARRGGGASSARRRWVDANSHSLALSGGFGGASLGVPVCGTVRSQTARRASFLRDGRGVVLVMRARVCCVECAWGGGVVLSFVRPFVRRDGDDEDAATLPTYYHRYYDDSSLVDPASSYMLVSKIKPCMSQCKPY